VQEHNRLLIDLVVEINYEYVYACNAVVAGHSYGRIYVLVKVGAVLHRRT